MPSVVEVIATTEEKWDLDGSKKEEKIVDNFHAGGDTSFANASWQYKLIALVTALCFPSK